MVLPIENFTLLVNQSVVLWDHVLISDQENSPDSCHFQSTRVKLPRKTFGLLNQNLNSQNHTNEQPMNDVYHHNNGIAMEMPSDTICCQPIDKTLVPLQLA